MGFYGTSAGTFSDLSLSLQILVTALFIIGILQAQKHKSLVHYKLMTLGFFFDFSFMISYMLKRLIEGSTKFSGPEKIYKLVYLPVVVVHSFLSVGVLVLAGYMLWYGYKNSGIIGNIRRFNEREKYLRHKKFGYATAVAWIISFFTGISVYLLLYVFY